MRICIDAGHGGKDSGAKGYMSQEKDINLNVAFAIGEKALKANLDLVYTRSSDQYVSLIERNTTVTKQKCDYCISIHCNSSSSYDDCIKLFYNDCPILGKELAVNISKKITDIFGYNNIEIKKGSHYILKASSVPSCLIEMLNISNQDEERKLNDKLWQSLFAEAVANVLIEKSSVVNKDVQLLNKNEKITIMGESIATAEKMENYTHSINPHAPFIAKLYLNIGKEEGVRGDIAYAQTLLETDYFSYNGEIPSDINNYAGIMSIGDLNAYEIYDTPAKGIKAHIQHLKALGSIEKLNSDLFDASFHLVQRESALYWSDLDDKWYYTKLDYGIKILNIWEKLLLQHKNNNIELERTINEWRKKGIIRNEIDLDKTITWREFIQLQNKLMQQKQEG